MKKRPENWNFQCYWLKRNIQASETAYVITTGIFVMLWKHKYNSFNRNTYCKQQWRTISLTFIFFHLALYGSKALRWTERKMVMGLWCHQDRDPVHHPQGHAECGFRRAFWKRLIQDALYNRSYGDPTGRCCARLVPFSWESVFGWKIFRMNKFALEWRAKPKLCVSGSYERHFVISIFAKRGLSIWWQRIHFLTLVTFKINMFETTNRKENEDEILILDDYHLLGDDTVWLL
jgi:hypothetical protein